MNKTVFITGTDTGVGKTLFTALLLHDLRADGENALAMKPFCSGSRRDVELLQAIQRGALPDSAMNPFFCAEPVAPLIASRRHRAVISLDKVLMWIQAAQLRCDYLLVEGCGGLMVPLGPGYSVASVIVRLGCPVVVIARNRLGAINHILLTVMELQQLGVRNIMVVFMHGRLRDPSSTTNLKIVRELVPAIGVLAVPFLGPGASTPGAVRRNSKKIKKTLALVTSFVNFSHVLCETGDRQHGRPGKKRVLTAGRRSINFRLQ